MSEVNRPKKRGERVWDAPKIPVDLILAKLAEDAEKAQARAIAHRRAAWPLETAIATTPYDVVYEEDPSN